MGQFKAESVMYNCFYIASFAFIAIGFIDVKVRYDKIFATRDWLKEEVTTFVEPEVASRNRRSVDQNLPEVISKFERQIELLEFRLNRSKAFRQISQSSLALLLPYLRGPRGPPGSPGVNGEKGDDGIIGRVGKTGPTGPSGEDIKHFWNHTGRSTYVRWGRNTCPNVSDTELIYSGYTAGQWYQHTGGMSNTVCLHRAPNYAKTSDADTAQWIYGTEYETNSFAQFSGLQNEDAPCAVCGVRSRGSQIMIPGRNECPDGWTREYKGYLVSEHYGHKGRSSAVCVDSSAEGIPKTKPDKDGNLWYVIQASCGSLPCGPYVQGRELTCAVCTM